MEQETGNGVLVVGECGRCRLRGRRSGGIMGIICLSAYLCYLYYALLLWVFLGSVLFLWFRVELDLLCFLVAFWSEQALLGSRGILLHYTRKTVLGVSSSGVNFLEHGNGVCRQSR